MIYFSLFMSVGRGIYFLLIPVMNCADLRLQGGQLQGGSPALTAPPSLSASPAASPPHSAHCRRLTAAGSRWITLLSLYCHTDRWPRFHRMDGVVSAGFAERRGQERLRARYAARGVTEQPGDSARRRAPGAGQESEQLRLQQR